MPSMTFRFTTECTLTLCGSTYEDIYLKFKDFQHGDMNVQKEGIIKALPPESGQLFFSVDDNEKLYEIASFKGSFPDDIKRNCQDQPLVSPPVKGTQPLSISAAVKERIAEVYW